MSDETGMTDNRHFHDGTMHAHPNGSTPHVHNGFPPRPARSPQMTITLVVGIVLLILGALKVAGNISARTTPPAACQLLGGQWNLWDGWQCC